jgi:hypothetical protein
MEKLSNERVKAKIARLEYEKPRLILWTEQNEEELIALRELLAYRQSGALEALKAAEPALWILAASGNKDAAEKHRAILATIAKLEAM